MSSEEINIGDYVRTKLGYICKIVNINDFREPSMKYGVEASYLKDIMFIGDEDIIKSSPNIIDLIEVGDLVKIENEGWVQVSIKFEVLKFFDNSGTEYLYEEIKGIITKEQITSMEYKIGE